MIYTHMVFDEGTRFIHRLAKNEFSRTTVFRILPMQRRLGIDLLLLVCFLFSFKFQSKLPWLLSISD